jgi:hypothetical protein
MSEWITDRLPTEEDATSYGFVWTTFDGIVISRDHRRIEIGEPWQPIQVPAPYVKPKRWTCDYDEYRQTWVIVDNAKQVIVLELQLEHEGAARRICDIYNGVRS